MRHSNCRTMLKHYAVLGLTDATRGMDQVPSIGKSKRNMATGTCENNPQQYLQQSQHGRGRNHANRRDKPATGTDGNANTQSSVSADKCTTTRDGATLNEPPAGVAQLVERQLPKLNVEGSSPFTRFFVWRRIKLHIVAKFRRSQLVRVFRAIVDDCVLFACSRTALHCFVH